MAAPTSSSSASGATHCAADALNLEFASAELPGGLATAAGAVQGRLVAGEHALEDDGGLFLGCAELQPGQTRPRRAVLGGRERAEVGAHVAQLRLSLKRCHSAASGTRSLSGPWKSR
jgi:hypothetical protein